MAERLIPDGNRVSTSINQLLLAGCVAAALLSPGNGVSAATFTKVAMTGDMAPGTNKAFLPIPRRFPEYGFTSVTLTSTGQVAFKVRLEHDINNLHPRGGIWTGTPGNLQPLLLDNYPTAGLPEGQTLSVFDFTVSVGFTTQGDNGEVAFSAVAPVFPYRDTLGVWQGTPSDLREVVLLGEQAPGMQAGWVFDTFSSAPDDVITARLNANGGLFFTAGTTDGQATSSGLWLANADGISPIVIPGQQVAGQDPGIHFTSVGLGTDSPNEQVLFTAKTNDGPDGNRRGLWIGGEGMNPRPIVQHGDFVSVFGGWGEQYPHDAEVRSLDQPILNNAGQVLTRVGNYGLWLDTNGDFSPVARRYEFAPGLPDGSFFRSFGGSELNDAGEVAFTNDASIKRADGSYELRTGLWAGQPDALSLIVLEGDPAPGLPGLTINDLQDYSVKLNNAGQIVFKSRVGYRDVLWSVEPGGDPQLILGPDESIEVAPGDFRTVSNFLVNGFNDLGQVLLTVRFTDSTEGLFITTVPEPGTGMIGLVSLAAITRRRRR